MRLRRLGVAGLAVATAVSCGDGGRSVPPLVAIDSAELRVEIDTAAARLRVIGADGTELLVQQPPDRATPEKGGAALRDLRVGDATTFSGWFFPRTELGARRRVLAARSARVAADGSSAVVVWETEDPARSLRLEAAIAAPGVATIAYAVDPPPAPADAVSPTVAISETLRSAPGERFYGMGERFSGPEHSGKRLENWTQEGAFMLGDDPVAELLGPFPHPTTYFPMPFYLSTSGYALSLGGTAYSTFDFGASDASEVRIEAWGGALTYTVFVGANPKEILTRAAQALGLPRPIPRWAFAPWNDAVGGQEEVRRVAKVLRDNHVPSGVIWTEDWSGALANPEQLFPTADGTIDRALYPDIEEVAAELHAAGFKFVSYYNPQVHTDAEDYVTARDEGYLLRRASGEDALFFHVFGEAGQVDLTNPAARAWMKTRLQRSLDLGFDGWMADFGEYTPFDTVAFDGEPGATHHNRVPELWAGLQREFFAEARPDGDWLTFARSGFTGSRSEVAVVWGGDPDTTFSQQDGLPAALYAGLSLGISGIPFYGHDIAGYFSLLTPNSDRELFLRWAAFGALSPIMRTHHGLEYRSNWSFDRDPETLAAYRELARLHISLTPYLEALADAAVRTGVPLMRHLYLEYPEDLIAWDVHDEYLLGPDLLVAPVMRRGATGREVYLPAGVWRDYFAPERVVTGGRRIQVEAPLGTIPVWVRDGATIPTIDPLTETLVPAAG